MLEPIFALNPSGPPKQARTNTAYIVLSTLALAYMLLWLLKQISGLKGTKTLAAHPPIVHLSSSDIFDNPQAAYENALAQHGRVIGVTRKGRLEYIVDETLTQRVLTTDNDFSFEEGTATILNIHKFFHLFKSFFQEMDDVVQNGINARLPTVLDQILPVFFEKTKDLLDGEKKVGNRHVDIFEHAHSCIGESMILVIFGKSYINKRNLEAVISVAVDIANVTGMYQNTSIFARTFPSLWRILSWTRFIFACILYNFMVVLGPQTWKFLRGRRWNQDADDIPENVLSYLARRHASKIDGTVSIRSTLWILVVLLGLFFASVHQTASAAVWVVFELAKRPEYLEGGRREVLDLLNSDNLELNPGDASRFLERATRLDSFIREVLRTKGDTLSTCRRTTRDVSLGGYIIPKGHLVIPLATLSHGSKTYHGKDAHIFYPERWHGSNSKPAIMGSSSYFPFGLGRWACPGRMLAVAEIKFLVWSISIRSSPRLEGDSYRVVDRLNITSVPPEGNLFLDAYTQF